MRATVASAALLAMLGACGGSDSSPSLTITPNGSGASLAVSSATNFLATLVNSDDPVTWTVTGGGALTSMTGLHTTFTPPTGSATETLTATAGPLSATVTITSGPQTLTAETIAGLSAPVTVMYDAQQIPHINCAAANDCIAVQGYVTARDRMFPMEFLRHVARSNLAELIGIAGLSQDVQIRTLFVTRAGHRIEDDLTAAMDPTTAATLTAYCNGINAYYAQLRANSPTTPLGGEYAQLPFRILPTDVQDWTPQDTWALARLQQFQLSETISEETDYGNVAATWGPGGALEDLGKLAAYVRAAAPPTEQAHTLAPTPYSMAIAEPSAGQPIKSLAPWAPALQQVHQQFVALRNRLRPLNSAVGSNNWVISKTISKANPPAAMVANDPHLGLQYPPLFYLSVMTSSNAADNLDLAGGSFPGIPGALVGRGAHVGWGVTVTGYDVTDLYLETTTTTNCAVAALGIPCVTFNGNTVTPVVVPESYNVRTAAGLVDASTLGLSQSELPPVNIIFPEHGPVIQLGSTYAITVRWTGQEGNTQDLKAVYGLNTATDVDAAMASLKGFATGAQNFVLADDQGNIGYDPHALVPVRNFADARVVGANVIPPWFPLPGTGEAEWGDGSDNCAAGSGVAAGCWIDDSLLPQGENPTKGYFFTANADPTYPSVSDDNNPLAHPPYLSFDWDDSTGFRATRIDQMINEINGSNGGIAEADMETIQSDHMSREGKVFVDYIDALPAGSGGGSDEATARMILDMWASNGYDCPSGLTGSSPTDSPADTTAAVQINSAGCFLFHAFIRQLFTNVFADDLAIVGDDVDGSMVQVVKGMIYMLGLPDNDPGATFCNDVDATGATVATHACSEQVVTALVEAYDQVAGTYGTDTTAWTWGRVHTMQPVPLVALVTTNYEPGPYARPGGAFTVDVGTPSGETSSGLSFPYNTGGNVRHISVMDPTTPLVKMQLPGPEVDGPALIIGPNLLGQWVLNQYFDFAFGSQINQAVVSTQTFSAQ